jgi:hypothetical protein
MLAMAAPTIAVSTKYRLSLNISISVRQVLCVVLS